LFIYKDAELIREGNSIIDDVENEANSLDKEEKTVIDLERLCYEMKQRLDIEMIFDGETKYIKWYLNDLVGIVFNLSSNAKEYFDRTGKSGKLKIKLTKAGNELTIADNAGGKITTADILKGIKSSKKGDGHGVFLKLLWEKQADYKLTLRTYQNHLGMSFVLGL